MNTSNQQTNSQEGFVLQGRTASRGLVFGNTFLYEASVQNLSQEVKEAFYNKRGYEQSDQRIDHEILRLDQAREQALESLEKIISQTRKNLGDEAAHIFRSQQTMIEDDSIREEMVDHIRLEAGTAEFALVFVFDQYIELFSQMGEEDYNKARVADVQDVKQRLLRKLLGKEDFDPSSMPAQSLVIARDLLPSDTALFNKEKVAGIILQEGGITSHAAILANNLGIPAAVGVGKVLDLVQRSGVPGFLDCRQDKASLYIEPNSKQLGELKKELKEYMHQKELIEAQKSLPSETKDGTPIILSANIGTPDEAHEAKALGAETVGLFRSEFLFLGKDQLPDEETQFLAYKEVLELFDPGFVIIRTLDAGGDKQIPTLSIEHEENPFLGYRALRICLDREDVFKPQLRALLRAGVYGNLKVMFPMVAGIDDFRKAMALVKQVKRELKDEHIPFGEHVQFGVMIEIPSAVYSLDHLLKEVDFVSVGTNDLTQYLFAADRMNNRVANYYRSFDPALFRCLEIIGEQGTRAGKMVGLCGELGGDPDAIPVLVGLGFQELSMSAHSLAQAKFVVRQRTLAESRAIAQKVVKLEDQDQVHEYIRSLDT